MALDRLDALREALPDPPDSLLGSLPEVMYADYPCVIVSRHLQLWISVRT